MSDTGGAIRRAADRAHTRTEWLDSAHSFSFGHAYDPDNIQFGALLAFNEDRLSAHHGYDRHLHRDTEIVSWVLSGELTHQDSAGRCTTLRPGSVQLMSAGRGIEHSERNDSPEPLHFLQMWLMPTVSGTEPGYQQLDVSARLTAGELVRVASSEPSGGELHLHAGGAALWIARIAAGGGVELPVTELGYAFIARGSAAVAGIGNLNASDEVRLDRRGAELLAGDRGAEVLFWQLPHLR